MAKPADPDAKLLDGLTRILSGEPKPLAGKDAVFPGKPGQALTDRALELGYLERMAPPAAPVGATKGKKAKAVPLARITPKGREWVAEQVAPRVLLEALHGAIEDSSAALTPGHDVGTVVEQQLAILQHALDQVRDGLAHVKQFVDRAMAERKHDLENVRHVLETARRVVDQRLVPAPVAPPLKAVAPEEIEAALGVWHTEQGRDCPLPDLYRVLSTIHAGLTIGRFHDLIRTMHAAGRIRLARWAEDTNEVVQPELALVVRDGVMYFAALPGQQNTTEPDA